MEALMTEYLFDSNKRREERPGRTEPPSTRIRVEYPHRRYCPVCKRLYVDRGSSPRAYCTVDGFLLMPVKRAR
jgi:hypothetical protein